MSASIHVLPGQTIGIFGSGQLGRMLTQVAKRMGYTVKVFSPDSNTPAGQVADEEITAAYTDMDAVRAFASSVDVITVEFENIPYETLQLAQSIIPVRPSAQVLYIAQNRLREKTTLQNAGLPVVPFKAIHAKTDINDALEFLGGACVMKTAGFGYDGKGQAKVQDVAQAHAAYSQLGEGTVILEAFVAFETEVSVVAARSQENAFAAFSVAENHHVNHILDVSVAPCTLRKAVQENAVALAKRTLEVLGVIGVMCVEFFVLPSGELLINEVAPRPHNSGHLTIEACACSQFEQQLRAVCGLPLGDSTPLHEAAMVNLLGDLWAHGEPDWQAALALPGVQLHLYGKAQARAGRKMGHITVTGADAQRRVKQARQVLMLSNNGIS